MALAAAKSASVTASWGLGVADRDGGVRHERIRGGAVPMPFVRRDPHRVTRANALGQFTFLAHKSEARGDLKQLTVLVLVPHPAGAVREDGGADLNPVGLWKDRINHSSPVAAGFSSEGSVEHRLEQSAFTTPVS
jgi:hypothetical protein